MKSFGKCPPPVAEGLRGRPPDAWRTWAGSFRSPPRPAAAGSPNSPAVSSADQTLTDEPLTITDFEAIGDTTFELVAGDLHIGGRCVGHGPLARGLLRWLARRPRA
jgi:hypothetical protein